MHGCIFSTVAADASVLMYQYDILSADWISIVFMVFDLIYTEISKLLEMMLENKILKKIT